MPAVAVADNAAVMVPAPVLNDRVPVRAPTVPGVNVRFTTHVLETGKEAVQLVDANEKSEPVIDAALGTETVSGP